MRHLLKLFTILLLPAGIPLHATVFANLHGVVHDPQHRPIAGAHVMLHANQSEFSLTATTNAVGEFDLQQVPIGVYTLAIGATGFNTTQESIPVASGTNPVLHVQLSVETATQTVIVPANLPTEAADSVTPTTLITRQEIESTPGASRTLGMEMITDYVPGAYMTHDMLHMRGGHQTSWLIDGIAIPNTKIASNVGPQIDPKDIDSLETQRGSYASDVGDRTYGVFNVLPRNGFEFDRSGELLLNGGNLGTGEAQLSLGNHSAATAWYLSLNGSRSNYGLATPVPEILHDSTNSESGFVSLIRNQSPRDQLRLDGQYRQDHFQIPYDPNPNDWEQASQYYESYGLRDAQTERDAFVIADWVHTLSPNALISFAPFYHNNQSNYDSNPADNPVSTTWHQGSNYVGGQADFHLDAGPNNFSGGAYTFYQDESDLFGVQVNDGSATSEPNTGDKAGAVLVEGFISDHLRLGHSFTLLGGMRFSSFHAGLNESAIYPRIGATFEIPRIHWVFRGFYGHFFQPAPLETVSSSVLNYASTLPSGENTFTPVPSERDEEHQFGVQIPWKGWSLDVANVKNRVNNFLDHSNLGESNMYFPIAVDGALVRAWELAVRSPQLGAPWPVSPRLLESNRGAARQHCRRVHLHPCQRSCLRPWLRLYPGRPRPAPHTQHRLYNEPAAPHMVLHKRLLRLRLHQRSRRSRPRPIQRRLSASPHHLRRFCRTLDRRALEICNQCGQRDQSPHPPRQFRHHRRVPLERPAHDLRRTPLPIPLLTPPA